MNDYAPLTGTVKEKYQTGKGKHGLIIDCDNPSFKYPIKGYDGTFGATLGLNVFQVGDKVEFKFEKTDFGTTLTQCTIQGGHGSQQDTSFNHGANVENRADEERVISSQPIVSSTNNDMDTYLQAVDTAYDKSQKFNNLRNLDGENLRAVCIGAAIQHMRSNGR
jgi:hypothetical protein|tara:strand:+ start:424 stop:915 length:492 start_codon:yes stop_codon:yes gene_type:complete